MDDARQPKEEIDVENDSLEIVAMKLGVDLELGLEKITLKECHLNYLNGDLDEKGNTLLIRFVKRGKADIVEFLMKCDGLNLNKENKDHDSAADIAWTEKQFVCLLKLLQGDADFSYLIDKNKLDDGDLKEFLENRYNLHEDIKLGNLQSIKKSTQGQKPSKYLCLKKQPYPKNQSAISWAAECKQIKVFSYLLNHGAKFKDSNEEKKCIFDDSQKKKLNLLLDEYFIKVDNSHVLKLMHSSHSPQGFTDERKAKIKDIYDHLNNSYFVRLIMKVLEHEDFDVVFDFESEYTDRLYCVSCRRIYGLTDPSFQKIFLGAEECETSEAMSTNVAGTLAHELCHMAMQVLYRNDTKPYEIEEQGNGIVNEYKNIVERIHTSCNDKSEDIDPVIKAVFKDYQSKWHGELIVRVPHILALYGDSEGMALLQKQVHDLLKFYSDHVVPKCESYTDPVFFKKHLCMIESLHEYHGCLQALDKEMSPFKVPPKGFEDFLIPSGNISVIVTKNTRLCCLHVYHVLKKSYQYHTDKKCLFFKLDCYQSNWENILNAFRSKVCRCMVLVTNKKMIDIKDISEDFDEFKGCNEDENSCGDTKKVILIVGEECEGLGFSFEKKKVLNYHWRDLTRDYKNRCCRQMVNFKGKGTTLKRWINEEKLSKIIEAEDMLRLTNNEQIELGDGKKLTSRGYIRDYYMEREFVKLTVEKSIFDGLPNSTALFVTGLQKEALEGLEINEKRIQWIKESSKEIRKGKRIFLLARDLKEANTFDDFFVSRLPVDDVHWVHFTNKEFHLRMSKGNTKAIGVHVNKQVFTELQLIEASKKRVILISDGPGTGKSTVVTNLIRIVKDKMPDCWLGRIDLNDYSDGKENPLGLANIEEKSNAEDVLNIFVRMLGMKSSLDIYLFEKFIMPRGLKREYKIFFDGFDEITSSYKENVLKLFRVLIKETTLQLWITTRKHERIVLEMEFDTFSYSMEQFTLDHQVRFLDRLWKHKIKSLHSQTSEEGSLREIETIGAKIRDILTENDDCDEVIFKSLRDFKEKLEESYSEFTSQDKLETLRSEIEGLDFTRLARSILDKISLRDEETRFMGIPLHLFMLGNVAYDKNWRGNVYSSVHGLYSEFVEGKIRIYWKEKGKVELETGIMKNIFESQRKKIIKFHIEVAKCVVDPKKYPRSSVEAGHGEEIDVVSVGILTKSENHFQFVHRSFAEYFFAEWILGNMERNALVEVLLEERFAVVRRFIASAFERKEIKVNLGKEFFHKLKLEVFFPAFIRKPFWRDLSGMHIFQKILEMFEETCDDITIDNFILKVAKFLHNKSWNDAMTMNAFRLLLICLTETMLFKMFGVHIKLTYKPLCPLIRSQTVENVSEILELLGKVFGARESPPRRIETPGSSAKEVSGEESEKVGIACEDEIKHNTVLFEARNEQGNSMLHLASLNPDGNVFIEVLKFFEGILGRESTTMYLLETNRDGYNILHCSVENGGFNIAEIVESIQERVSIREMLKGKDKKGRNILHLAVRRCYLTNNFGWLLGYLSRFDGGEMVREMLLEKDIKGKNIAHHATVLSSEVIDGIMRQVRIYLKDDEKLKELVTSTDDIGQTVFHRAAKFGSIEHLKVLETWTGKEQFGQLLANVDNYEQTCLHVMMDNAYITAKEIVSQLHYISEVLDEDAFKKFLLATNKARNTFLHCAVSGGSVCLIFSDLIDSVRSFLPETLFRELINIRNKNGEVVDPGNLHDAVLEM